MNLTRREALLAGVGLVLFRKASLPLRRALSVTRPQAATITLSTADHYFRPGEMLRCDPSGEILHVLAVDGRTLTVRRGVDALAA